MSSRVLVLLAVVVAGVAVGAGSLGSGDDHAGSLDGRVTRVVDGDTIHVRLDASGRDETVRYIGIDTPETHHPTKPVQCYGRAAAAFNRRLVDGRRVRLTLDAEARDRYGRLLAYVTREPDGLPVNATLARSGSARTLTIAPNTRHARQYATLVATARRHRQGLWGTC